MKKYLNYMHLSKALVVLCLFALLTGCKSKDPLPLADLNQLNGEWKSEDFPVPVTVVFSMADTTAKITAVATNTWSFKTGDVFWRGVIPTGASTYRLGQLTRSRTGYYAFIAGVAHLSGNTLEISYSGDTDDSGQLKLDGKKARFTRQ